MLGLVAFLVVTPLFVSACRPKGPDPWFSSQLTFDKSNLPVGVEIVETSDQYHPYAIRNLNEEPLYLVSKEPTYNENYPVFTASSTNQTYRVSSKLEKGRNFLYNPGSFVDTPVGWMENTDTNNNPVGNASIDDYNIIVSKDFIEENIEDYYYSIKIGDDRPANINLPKSQPFTFLAFYKDRLITINGIKSFQLNGNYDSKRGEKNRGACNPFNLYIVPIIIFLVVIIGFCLLLRYLRRRFAGSSLKK